MKIKKTLLIISILSTILIIAGCGGNNNNGNEGSSESINIKFASFYSSDHPQTKSANKFKELVGEKSDGKINIEVYPDNQLGPEDSYIPSIKDGNVEMGVAGTMINEYGSPLISVTEMPFLFDDWDHAEKVLTGEIGDELSEPLLEESGLRGISWTVNGFRQVSSNKSIENIDDFKGLKIRVPNVPYYVEMAKGFGANPVTMSLDELFTSLEQKAVDAQDNPYSTDLASSFYEVQDYILETNHIFTPSLWFINNDFFEGLSEENQEIIMESAEEAIEYNWEISKEDDESSKQKLIDEGVEITEPNEAFQKELRESQESVEKWFYDEYSGSEELIERIRNEK